MRKAVRRRSPTTGAYRSRSNQGWTALRYAMDCTKYRDSGWKSMARSSVGLLRRTAFRIRWLQGGSLHLYLLYMILALITLLLVAQWAG